MYQIIERDKILIKKRREINGLKFKFLKNGIYFLQFKAITQKNKVAAIELFLFLIATKIVDEMSTDQTKE